MALVQEWPFVQLFFLGKIGQENVFYEILERKNAFLGQKTWSSKSLKIDFFSRRVNPKLWSKNGHFSNFFLGNLSQENVFYDILKRKNTFLGYKKKTLKKLKNWHFFEFLNFPFL